MPAGRKAASHRCWTAREHYLSGFQLCFAVEGLTVHDHLNLGVYMFDAEVSSREAPYLQPSSGCGTDKSGWPSKEFR